MRYALAIVALTLLLCPSASAAARPDLTVKSIRVTSGEPRSGQPMTIAYKVANAGRATARATQVSFYLAFGATRAENDLLLGTRKLPKLKRRRTRTAKAVVTVPRAAGLFRVIACLDDRRVVRESNEGNNCRATGADLHVAAPTES